MHARVVLGRVKLDKQDEATKIFMEHIMPAAKEQKGFKNIHLLTDPETNKFISITIWETAEDMVAGEAGGYLQEQLDRIASLFVGPLTIQRYTVSV